VSISVVRCSWVKCGEVKRSAVKCSWVKCSGVLRCSDGLSNKVSNIIRRLMDNMKLLLIGILRLPHSFIYFRFSFLSMYIWFYSRLIMYFMYFYCYGYVFLLYVYVWLP
jgi:hypothetical protein